MNELNKKIRDLEISLLSKYRLYNIYEQCQKFKDTDYSFVECGVAKGGSLAMIKYSAGSCNKVFGFDSFDGMPNITQEDIGEYNKSDPLLGFGKVGQNLSEGIENVYKTFDILGIDMHNVKLVKGYFEDTLVYELKNIGKIAVLRLDSDWYKSTKFCLETLYDSVIDGGIIIIDDYGHWVGCKRAVDDFREKRNIKAPLLKTKKDYTEVYWIK
tara:strand:+ start:57 stop:695 length:639 start_codon:yes stop_codon:yes gene_type:complete